ncbi:MAG: hypothetical protein KDA60_19375 [Planctomycetales bacterium]|nr:hypothetical protein [Planctomycetales bacterium]
MPPQTVNRYLQAQVNTPHHLWRFNHKCRVLPAGKVLRVESMAPAIVRWTSDKWQTIHETGSVDSRMGMHFADLETTELDAGTQISFTFFWPLANSWEGTDFQVRVA